MSVAALLTVPVSPQDWLFWSLQHWEDHQQLAAAIAAKGGPGLWVPPLDPVPFDSDAIENWLSWHQQLHLNMNNATNQTSQDLESVDFRDPAQLRDWIYLDWVEHQNNHTALGI